MPYLGEYIGLLLAEMTRARAQSDTEAVRVAEAYQSDPLLKHLPVPHFRMPEVTISTPVIIKEQKPAAGETPPPGWVGPVLKQKFRALFSEQLTAAGVKKFNEAKVMEAVDTTLSALLEPSPGQPAAAPPSITPELLADKLVDATQKNLRETLPTRGVPGNLPDIMEKLREAARGEFRTLYAAPPRLDVAITTAEIREASRDVKPGEILATFNMTIREECFEWTVIDTDEGTRQRLVPE